MIQEIFLFDERLPKNNSILFSVTWLLFSVERAFDDHLEADLAISSMMFVSVAAGST